MRAVKVILRIIILILIVCDASTRPSEQWPCHSKHHLFANQSRSISPLAPIEALSIASRNIWPALQSLNCSLPTHAFVQTQPSVGGLRSGGGIFEENLLVDKTNLCLHTSLAVQRFLPLIEAAVCTINPYKVPVELGNCIEQGILNARLQHQQPVQKDVEGLGFGQGFLELIICIRSDANHVQCFLSSLSEVLPALPSVRSPRLSTTTIRC
mmetsp:Transcript_89386/g.158619  ORF Transcript_89386/g.158619 Transcript_89386/m.158619 type:complete len:211 (+) Transcript_89386:864-1496(+)